MTTSSSNGSRRAARIRAGIGIVLGVLLFVVALFFDVVTYTSPGRDPVVLSGTLVLMIGALGPLGFHVGWYANLFLPIAWGLSLVASRKGTILGILFGLVALVLALSSYLTLWRFPTASFAVSRDEWTCSGFGPAIFVWTGAMLTGLAAPLLSLVKQPSRT